MGVPRRPIPPKKKQVRKEKKIIRLVIFRQQDQHKQEIRTNVSSYANEYKRIMPQLWRFASIASSYFSIFLASLIVLSPTLPHSLMNLKLPSSIIAFRGSVVNSARWPLLSTILFKIVSSIIGKYKMQWIYPVFQVIWRFLSGFLIVIANGSPAHFYLELAARWVSLLVIVLDDASIAYLMSELGYPTWTTPAATAFVISCGFFVGSNLLSYFDPMSVYVWFSIGVLNLSTIFQPIRNK